MASEHRGIGQSEYTYASMDVAPLFHIYAREEKV
jgi:hypothetical protein